MSFEQFRTNDCVVLLKDVDDNCQEGDLAKIVEINSDQIYIQYSTERGYTSKPIQIDVKYIKPFRFYYL